MTFLQPWFLIALPLAALPIIIHLLNLRRHRKVEWGAMMFLLAATRQRRGHTRLRHFLILLSRILAVLGLIFVVTRPLAGRWFSLLAGRPDTVIVVLDRSASMSQQDVQTGSTKRSVAVEQIASSLERAGVPRNLVLIESTGQAARALGSPQALREIPEAGPTDGAANIVTMLQSALDYITANNSGRTDVWVCSDLQSHDWNAEGGRWSDLRSAFQDLKQPVRFHLLTYAESAPENLSVRILKLRREKGSGSDRLVMDIQIRRPQGGAAVQVPLNIVVDGARSVVDVELTGDVLLLSDQGVSVDADKPAGWGKIELPQDANPRDNVYFFAYGDSVQHRTVIVSDEAGSAWPLELAAAPARDAGTAAARTITSADLASLEWEKTSLILWQAPLPASDNLAAVERFVAAGGAIIFFPHGADDANTAFGLRWENWDRLPADLPQAIETWRDDTGLLAHADAGQPLPVNLLSVRDYRRLQGAQQPLARLAGGEPLVTRVPTDRGGVYFVTTLPQDPYSSFSRDGIVFFVMVQRALRQGAERLLGNQFGEIDKVAWVSQNANTEAVDGWPEAKLSTEQPYVAGIYQRAGQWIARNRPLSEDQGGTLRTDQLDTLFAGLNYRIVQDTMQASRSLVSEIWRIFALLLLVALIAEASLCLPDVQPAKGVGS